MPEAARQRPDHAVVVYEFRSRVDARPKPVFEALAERFDPGPGAQSLFTADSAAGLIIVQGGGWYRAEYRVIPDHSGSRVEHVVVNVARPGKRIGRRLGREVIEAAPAEFERLMVSLRAEFG